MKRAAEYSRGFLRVAIIAEPRSFLGLGHYGEGVHGTGDCGGSSYRAKGEYGHSTIALAQSPDSVVYVVKGYDPSLIRAQDNGAPDRDANTIIGRAWGFIPERGGAIVSNVYPNSDSGAYSIVRASIALALCDSSTRSCAPWVSAIRHSQSVLSDPL